MPKTNRRPLSSDNSNTNDDGQCVVCAFSTLANRKSIPLFSLLQRWALNTDRRLYIAFATMSTTTTTATSTSHRHVYIRIRMSFVNIRKIHKTGKRRVCVNSKIVSIEMEQASVCVSLSLSLSFPKGKKPPPQQPPLKRRFSSRFFSLLQIVLLLLFGFVNLKRTGTHSLT